MALNRTTDAPGTSHDREKAEYPFGSACFGGGVGKPLQARTRVADDPIRGREPNECLPPTHWLATQASDLAHLFDHRDEADMTAPNRDSVDPNLVASVGYGAASAATSQANYMQARAAAEERATDGSCETDDERWARQSSLGAMSADLAAVVDHPQHYNSHPSGIECIDVVEHMNFNRGNAIKYIWRAGAKGNELEDLQKARWYVDREIQRLTTPTPRGTE